MPHDGGRGRPGGGVALGKVYQIGLISRSHCKWIQLYLMNLTRFHIVLKALADNE